MNKEDMLAEPVFDGKLGKWTVIVETNGEKVPVGQSHGICFEISKWDSEGAAEEWIKSKFPNIILKTKESEVYYCDICGVIMSPEEYQKNNGFCDECGAEIAE